MKVLSLETATVALGQGVCFLEASNAACDRVSVQASCRGQRPWQVIELFILELGRTVLIPGGASNKLKRQGGSKTAR